MNRFRFIILTFGLLLTLSLQDASAVSLCEEYSSHNEMIGKTGSRRSAKHVVLPTESDGFLTLSSISLLDDDDGFCFTFVETVDSFCILRSQTSSCRLFFWQDDVFARRSQSLRR